MTTRNPYIRQGEPSKPLKVYKLTFLPIGVTVEVDPLRVPYGDHGLPGSVLDVALAHGVTIDHACGGLCACSTCHIIVKEGLASTNRTTEEEEDELDNAPGLTPMSRLACCCVPSGECDVVVEVPNWNRNLVSEGY